MKTPTRRRNRKTNQQPTPVTPPARLSDNNELVSHVANALFGRKLPDTGYSNLISYYRREAIRAIDAVEAYVAEQSAASTFEEHVADVIRITGNSGAGAVIA